MTLSTLLYHYILPEKDKRRKFVKGISKKYLISDSDFEEQLNFLNKSKLEVINPYRLRDIKKKNVNQNYILITFDDGTITDYEFARKTLSEFDYKAIFFIITGKVGKENYLSKNHLVSLEREGHIIGSHSQTHENFSILPKSSQKEEFINSKKFLEDILGKEITHFAYPYGVLGTENPMNFGYEFIFTTKNIVDNYYSRFSIKRGMKMNTLFY
jgi:peptidoglycan/xylan/chitin deacetylase (PgdA/CDA1 family)